jgi:hypothetical protein
MWVKLTPDELAVKSRRLKRQRILTAIYVTILSFLIVIFFNGETNALLTGYFFTPLNEMLERLPVSIIFSVIIGLGVYLISGKEKPTLVCTKCGSKIHDSNSRACDCGGSLEDTKHFKWVDGNQ